jgi:hypothetical protein
MIRLKNYKLIIGIVWSGNRLLPKASLLHYKNKFMGTERYYSCGYTNKYKNFTYRLKPIILKIKP